MIRIANGNKNDQSEEASVKLENDVIYNIFKKYNLKSMSHLSCGILMKTHKIIFNLTQTIQNFKYYGCDLKEDIIQTAKSRFKHMSHKWKFEKLNYVEKNLPENYDFIITKEALMNLSHKKLVKTLHNIANTKGAKYLLITSFNVVRRNYQQDSDKFHPTNLLIEPFNLTGYVEIFRLSLKRMFVLYDIPNYLSKINFNSIKI